MFRTMCIVFVLLVCFCVPAFAGTGASGMGMTVGVLSAGGRSTFYSNAILGVSSQETYNLTFSVGWAIFNGSGRSVQVFPLMLNIESKPTKTYFGVGAGEVSRSFAGDTTLHSEFGYQVYGGFKFSQSMFLEGKLIGTSGQTMYGISVGNRF